MDPRIITTSELHSEDPFEWWRVFSNSGVWILCDITYGRVAYLGKTSVKPYKTFAGVAKW